MKYNDFFVSGEDQFSIGVEEESGRCYISIPFSNHGVDYDEYFEINKDEFDKYLNNFRDALGFAELCRKGKNDHLIIKWKYN
ncbi:hypothetical protein [Dickeya parazeae]|uniref:hypothetical protein n=1 Tax=Dickeya parazeae TaxID=2893572 RepID=UPI001AECA282|nr:hypothetical protein [Dickeya parazeae]MBP2836267.1 hypothetical protein [Dickeya parazeae]